MAKNELEIKRYNLCPQVPSLHRVAQATVVKKALLRKKRNIPYGWIKHYSTV